ncbi:MAG: hypothetical protein V1839_01170 [archaeon]
MNRKAQSTVIGFLAITAIAIVIAGTTFLWAKPLLDRTMAQDEVLRIENRMLELHAAITRVANTQSQASVSFDITKGTLTLDQDNSIIFKMFSDLANPYQNVVLLGNGTTELGILGVNEPAYILEQGSYLAKLHYIVLYDTATGNCKGIRLEPGGQVTVGQGRHSVFLKWARQNETTVAGCASTTLQVVQVDIE